MKREDLKLQLKINYKSRTNKMGCKCDKLELRAFSYLLSLAK